MEEVFWADRPNLGTINNSMSGTIVPSTWWTTSTSDGVLDSAGNGNLDSNITEKLELLENRVKDLEKLVKGNSINCVLTYKGYFICNDDRTGSYTIFGSEMHMISSYNSSIEACMEYIDDCLV